MPDLCTHFFCFKFKLYLYSTNKFHTSYYPQKYYFCISMKLCTFRYLLFLFYLCLFLGCANITTPTGGKKDKTPPKLIEIEPKDSLLNTRVTKVEMHFDEYITVSDASTEVEISPILKIPPSVLGINKKVTVKIIDSLLDSNTTYRIKFGKAIKDLHEGNPFRRYTYIFSTGSYFDSMQLSGSVLDAASGLADTSGIIIALYNASAKDSDVIRKKPKYITKITNKGTFLFKGLPKRSFKMYALKETNNNLIYDGIGEKIAFHDSTVIPGDTLIPPILLRLFEEKVDTAYKNTDTLGSKKKTDSLGVSGKKSGGWLKAKVKDSALTYTIKLDTTNPDKRSFDFANNNIKIIFNMKPVFNKEKVTLTYEKDGVATRTACIVFNDTASPLVWQVKTDWQENTLYTLRLIKGFAKDTAGADLMPSKFKFRTFEEDDYGKIKIHLPSKYNDSLYILRVDAEKDSIYQKRITDTMVYLPHLKPNKYRFKVIVDKNGNGKWDTGDLFAKQQPEVVIPYYETVNLKAGWELIIDFDKKPAPKIVKDQQGK